MVGTPPKVHVVLPLAMVSQLGELRLHVRSKPAILWSSEPQLGVATASSPQLLPRPTLAAKPFAADHAILPALPARRAVIEAPEFSFSLNAVTFYRYDGVGCANVVEFELLGSLLLM